MGQEERVKAYIESTYPKFSDQAHMELIQSTHVTYSTQCRRLGAKGNAAQDI